MPEFIVDRFDGGDAEVVTIDYADMRRWEVEQLAWLGDSEAKAWLETHPLDRD